MNGTSSKIAVKVITVITPPLYLEQFFCATTASLVHVYYANTLPLNMHIVNLE